MKKMTEESRFVSLRSDQVGRVAKADRHGYSPENLPCTDLQHM